MTIDATTLLVSYRDGCATRQVFGGWFTPTGERIVLKEVIGALTTDSRRMAEFYKSEIALEKTPPQA